MSIAQTKVHVQLTDKGNELQSRLKQRNDRQGMVPRHHHEAILVIARFYNFANIFENFQLARGSNRVM